MQTKDESTVMLQEADFRDLLILESAQMFQHKKEVAATRHWYP
jgi:hypothetical protein